MYKFVCTGRPSHISHSASKEQNDMTCPTCGEPTQSAEVVEKMREEGASVLDICIATGISAPTVRELFPKESA